MDNKLGYKLYYRRNLPHYQPVNGVLFITYRLAFSLPKRIVHELTKKAEKLKVKGENLSEESKKDYQIQCNKILFVIEDDFLGKYKQSPQWLKIDTIANLVIDSLLFYHEKRYELICTLIMSNHVHIIIKPLFGREDVPYSMSKIMKDHKSYVAHEANEILKRTGTFWHHENYDHCIRDEEEFNRIVNYILNNPIKAGLIRDFRDWEHYWINPKYFAL